MRIKKLIISAIAGVMILLPLALSAQRSSLNTYSPYTMYGIGDVLSTGTAAFRSMGGVGAAYRNNRITPYEAYMNPLNPASYSSMPRRAFIFNFEVEGSGYYLKDKNTKSSYNGFNVRNISIQMPLAKKLGFGLSVSPYSSVGYKIEQKISDDDMLAEIGDVYKTYEGEGDITQLRFGVGYELFKNFSLGVEMHYYLGYIDRMLNMDVYSYIEDEGYYSTFRSKNLDYSKASFGAGFQYDIISNPNNVLTLGGTYTMGVELDPKMKDFISSGEHNQDTVYFSKKAGKISLPDVYTIGVFYHKNKLSVGADYSFSNWGSKNRGRGYNGMRYVNTNSVRAGVQYTPNRFDIRSYAKRLSYRFGMVYDEYYMAFRGEKLNTKAITFGLGMPIKMGSPTHFNLGVEIGQRGTTKAGLVKANYFKITLGFSLFGEDDWFVKRKYN